MFMSEIPFNGLDIMTIRDRALNGERPHMDVYKLPNSNSNSIKSLIEKCWSHESINRPEFMNIVDDLLDIYDQLPEGGDTKFTDALGVDGNHGGDALDSLFNGK